MKKFLAFATLASVALVGCVNDEKMEMTSGAQKISFDNPVMSTQTRAQYGEITTSTYPTNESFKVFAKQHKGALTDWDDADDFWSEALEAKYDLGNSYWDTDVEYYWPSSDDDIKLSFGAYSPATLTGTNVQAAYSNNGLAVTGFEVEETVAEQIDLMYSGPILNKDVDEPNDVDGVDITFKHALSSIVFTAVDNDLAAQYTINSISVKGKFLTKGDFCENLSAINGSGTAGWSNAEGNGTETTYSLATGLSIEVQTSSTEITKGTSALLTIPHTETQLDDEAKVTINYTVAPVSGAASYKGEKTVALKEFLVSGTSSPISEWKLGNRYTYQFIFGGTSKIYFKPVITEWADGGTATVTIK